MRTYCLPRLRKASYGIIKFNSVFGVGIGTPIPCDLRAFFRVQIVSDEGSPPVNIFVKGTGALSEYWLGWPHIW
jgi:hypothetical protein